MTVLFEALVNRNQSVQLFIEANSREEAMVEAKDLAMELDWDTEDAHVDLCRVVEGTAGEEYWGGEGWALP